MPQTPIVVRLKSSPTAINAKAFDERSTATTMVVVGVDGDIVAIAKDDIAVVAMKPELAPEYFGK